MPHRTTRHGLARARPSTMAGLHGHVGPRHASRAGRAAWRGRELVRRSQLTPKSMQGLVNRVGQWWGYLDLGPDPADRRARPPAAEWLVRPTEAGRQAQRIWAPLTDGNSGQVG